MQCSSYETFFLRRVENRWVEVKDEVLPPLDPCALKRALRGALPGFDFSEAEAPS